MRKGCLYLLPLMVFLSAAELAADNPFSGSLIMSSGFFFGELHEEVYKGDTLISRLDWDEHIVPYLAYEGEFAFRGFFLGAQVLSAIPVEGGLLRDTDWMNADHTLKTHYSEHTSVFLKHFKTGGRIGYRFNLDMSWGTLKIAPFAGMLYRTREWAARDGFLQYALFGDPWTENTPKQYVKGNIITYESREWWPLVGLDIGFTKNRWSIMLGGDWYPYLFIDTIDSHYLKLERYYDSMRGGMGCLVEAKISYRPAFLRDMEFVLGVEWESIFPSKGSTSTGDIGQSSGLILEEDYFSKAEGSLWKLSGGIRLNW